jgi:carbon storage regulator CsrA
MLVLSRKRREAILIQTANGPIRVVIERLNSYVARVGIEAPRECHIVREELAGLPATATGTETPQAA